MMITCLALALVCSYVDGKIFEVLKIVLSVLAGMKFLKLF